MHILQTIALAHLEFYIKTNNFIIQFQIDFNHFYSKSYEISEEKFLLLYQMMVGGYEHDW